MSEQTEQERLTLIDDLYDGRLSYQDRERIADFIVAREQECERKLRAEVENATNNFKAANLAVGLLQDKIKELRQQLDQARARPALAREREREKKLEEWLKILIVEDSSNAAGDANATPPAADLRIAALEEQLGSLIAAGEELQDKMIVGKVTDRHWTKLENELEQAKKALE